MAVHSNESRQRISSAKQMLADEMGRHLVALGVLRAPGGSGEQAHWDLYSGFLFRMGAQLHWITAAHNLAELDALRRCHGTSLVLQWFDVDERPGPGIPTAPESLSLRYDDPDRSDVGVVRIDPHAQALFESATHHRAFVTADLDEDPRAHTKLFIVGYPRETSGQVHLRRPSGGTVVFSAVGGCVQFHLLAQNGHSGSTEFWAHPNCIFGSISKAMPLASIVGLSGGPLIGITPSDSGGFSLRLLGVQSAWLRDSRIARAEPISAAIDLIRSSDAGRRIG